MRAERCRPGCQPVRGQCLPREAYILAAERQTQRPHAVDDGQRDDGVHEKRCHVRPSIRGWCSAQQSEKTRRVELIIPMEEDLGLSKPPLVTYLAFPPDVDLLFHPI